MRRGWPLLAGLALVAAAAPGLARDSADPLAGRVAGEPRECAPSIGVNGLVIAGPDKVMVSGTGRRRWVATAIGCPVLRSNDVLIVEHLAGGSDYCRNDRIRTLPRGGIIPGPFCRLSAFTPYDRPTTERQHRK